jgi:hypothetical protein
MRLNGHNESRKRDGHALLVATRRILAQTTQPNKSSYPETRTMPKAADWTSDV